MVEHRARADASVTLRAPDQFHSIDPLKGYPDRQYLVTIQKLVIRRLSRPIKATRTIAFPTQSESIN